MSLSALVLSNPFYDLDFLPFYVQSYKITSTIHNIFYNNNIYVFIMCTILIPLVSI